MTEEKSEIEYFQLVQLLSLQHKKFRLLTIGSFGFLKLSILIHTAGQLNWR